MALHNLVITVVDGGKSAISNNSTINKKKASNNEDNPRDGLLYKTLNYNQTIKNKLNDKMPPTTYFAVESAFQIAKQTTRQIANYYISDIGRSNGDSDYQAQVNRTVEVVGDVGGLLGGALSGAASGSMFGAVGAAVGAVVGLASSAISTGFKYAEKERAYQHERFKENTSQAYNLARANYSVSTGRVR